MTGASQDFLEVKKLPFIKEMIVFAEKLPNEEMRSKFYVVIYSIAMGVASMSSEMFANIMASVIDGIEEGKVYEKIEFFNSCISYLQKKAEVE